MAGSIMIRIVFDAFEIAPGMGKSRGIYTYSRHLLGNLARISDPSTELFVACNPASAADLGPIADKACIKVVGRTAVPTKLARQAWIRGRAAAYARHVGATIYFSPKGFLPWGLRLLSPGTRTVAVIHDLIPMWYSENYPGYFGWIEERVVTAGLTNCAKNADTIVAVSHSTAADIARYTARTEGVHVVYNGVPFRGASCQRFREPYIFAMTASLPHKNAEGVLRAYQRYREMTESPLQLVLCGVAGPPQEGVSFVDGLTDDQVHSYYAHARLFLFLSLIEGFGFPPLEALAHGTPVVCSDIPSLRETTRGMALYADPLDPDSVALVILKELAASRSESRKEHLRTVPEAYTWDQCAKGILAAIEETAARAI